MVKNLPVMQESQFQSLDWERFPGLGKIPWRREWLPMPVFLPGEFHGERSPVGYSSWGHKELDRTERLTLALFTFSGGEKYENKEREFREEQGNISDTTREET